MWFDVIAGPDPACSTQPKPISRKQRRERLADTLQIEIVTPERLLVSDQATEVQVPGLSGYLGILPGHAPLITELRSGEFSYRKPDGKVERLALHWGFAEVLPDKVTVLAER